MLKNYYDAEENTFYINKLEPEDYPQEAGPVSYMQRPTIEEIMKDNDEYVKLSTLNQDEIFDDAAFDEYITDRQNPEYNNQVYSPDQAFVDEMIYNTMPTNTTYTPERYNYDTNISIGGYNDSNYYNQQQMYQYQQPQQMYQQPQQMYQQPQNSYTGMNFHNQPSVNFNRQPEYNNGYSDPRYANSKFAFENRYGDYTNINNTNSMYNNYRSNSNNTLLNSRDFNEIRGITEKPNLGKPIHRGLEDSIADMDRRYNEIQEQKKIYGDDYIFMTSLDEEDNFVSTLSDADRQRNFMAKQQMEIILGTNTQQTYNPFYTVPEQPKRQIRITDLIEKNQWMNQYQVNDIDRHNETAIMLESIRIGHSYANNGIKKPSEEIRDEAYKNLKAISDLDKPKPIENMTKDEKETIIVNRSQTKSDYIMKSGINVAYLPNPIDQMLYESKSKQNEILKKCSCKAEMLRLLGDMYEENLMKDKNARMRFNINSQYDRGLYRKLGYMYGHRDQYGMYVDAMDRGEPVNLEDLEVRIPAPSIEKFERKNKFLNSIQADTIPLNIINEINFEKALAEKYDGKGTIRIEDTVPERVR